jgi:adenosylcobinamide-phosphate synthase
LLVALFAYIIDRIFGEFPFRHPVSVMGSYISWFEQRFYKDGILAGGILSLSLIALCVSISLGIQTALDSLPYAFSIFLTAAISSMFIASNMLFYSVRSALEANDKRGALAMLVSRDTAELDESEINKALIETYAENLSDGVIAPLFYLILLGLPGIVAYKAINTLDSMIGYRTDRYEKFGKISARLDDAANFIPARITALLIALSAASAKSVKSALVFGGKHKSPNAGYPIAAMAGVLDLKLGGPTPYHGKIVDKAYFGDGRGEIMRQDVERALGLQWRFDILIITFLSVWSLI